MKRENDFILRDLKHIWHPCSQMKDYESLPPLCIEKAEGSYLYTTDGKAVIDAISSWWCKSLGHGHPRIKKAVRAQLDKFEHVIMANTCNKTLVMLSEKLAELALPLDKIFYADNGSTAVEIAVKMSLQYHMQTGNSQRTNFAAFRNGYHGETILALAAGDCELYSNPYSSIIPSIPKIGPLPYVSGDESSEWDSMSEEKWKIIEERLEALHKQGGNSGKPGGCLAGIIFEPVLQGAGGMRIYSPDLLRRMRKWAAANGVHLIADEIMTGFGRTGKMFACGHAGITPDFIVLSKGLTAGWAPMSAVLCSTEIYDAFYDDYSSSRAFLHSNTYSGYAPAAAAALEAMNVYEDEKIIEAVGRRSQGLCKRMEWVASETGALANVRGIGFVAAADIIEPSTGKAFPCERRIGFQCYKKAVEFGALLRPLGDTIYFLPPLNTPDKVLDDLAEITVRAVKQVI